MGLLSPGGVHSHEDHINAMLEMAAQRGAEKIYLHAFLDGRDCPPRSAKPSLEKTQALIRKTRCWQNCLSLWPLSSPSTATTAGTE